MKPYFAKYLPTEDKITDGTKVMFKINNTWTEPCNFDSFLGSEIQDVAQGKLFICTRDIEIGDKVKIDVLENGILNDFIFERIEFDKEEDDDDIEIWCFNGVGMFFYYPSLDTTKPFKIIGEVSKNATWIKEGDEFDKKDLAYLIDEQSYLYFKDIKEWDIEGVNKYPIAIKCSQCNTYH